MSYYNLRSVDQEKDLSTPARDRAEALAIFGKVLGVELTLEETIEGGVSYFMDEWESGPHWVNPTIPVFIR